MFQGVSGCSNEFQWVSGAFQRISGGFRGVPGISRVLRKSHEERSRGVLGGVRAVHGSFRSVHGTFRYVTWGFKGFQGCSRDLGSQLRSRASRGVPGMFQSAPAGFRNVPGIIKGLQRRIREIQGLSGGPRADLGTFKDFPVG